MKKSDPGYEKHMEAYRRQPPAKDWRPKLREVLVLKADGTPYLDEDFMPVTVPMAKPRRKRLGTLVG